MLKWSCSLFLIFVIGGCYYDKEDLLYGKNTCDTAAVSFSADIKPIIDGSCATIGCHVQGGTGIGLLENYRQIKAKIDDGTFENRVITQLDMPPSAPLSDCQIMHIKQWVAEGALNN